MATVPDPQQNRLLAALPEAEWYRWVAHLEPVDMPLGKALYESLPRGGLVADVVASFEVVFRVDTEVFRKGTRE